MGLMLMDFAKGKPLTLMNGANLLYLLEKHGHQAKIDIKEAKRILGEERSLKIGLSLIFVFERQPAILIDALAAREVCAALSGLR